MACIGCICKKCKDRCDHCDYCGGTALKECKGFFQGMDAFWEEDTYLDDDIEWIEDEW